MIEELKNCNKISLDILNIINSIYEEIILYKDTLKEELKIISLFDRFDIIYRKCYNLLIQLWQLTVKLYRDIWYIFEGEHALSNPQNQQKDTPSMNIYSPSYDYRKKDSSIIYVDDDAHPGGNGSLAHPYQHIQDGIDASDEGDIIFVNEGFYSEHLSIGKSIEIVGQDKYKTVIDGKKRPHHLIWVTGKNVKMRGFTIQNSAKFHFSCGIILYSSNITIKGNIFKNNCVGLGLGPNSSNNRIEDNIFQNNILMGFAIDSKDQINNVIKNNSFENNDMFGLYTVNNYNIIENNNFVNDGIFISISDKQLVPEINNNIVNGKPLVCYKNLSNFKISNAGQIILSKCNNGIINSVNLSNTDTSIYVLSSSEINITNCNISNNLVGICLQSSNDIIILNNNISNNSWSGIWLYESDKNLISNNFLDRNNYGMFFFSSSRSYIQNNGFNNNSVGVSCLSSSRNNKILENNLINNNENAFDKCKNHWKKNYWDDWIGLKRSFIKWWPYNVPGRLFLNFDWHPANEPYDLT